MRVRLRAFGLLLALVLAGAAILAAREKQPLSEYQGRRQRLCAKVDGVVVLFGYTGREEISPAETFRQEENFYYLTGHEEPGAALIIVSETEASRTRGYPREILFLPPRDPAREHWEGVKLGPDDPDVAARTGFEKVEPITLLRSRLEEFLKVFANLYVLFPSPGPAGEFSHAGRWLAWLREIAPHANYRDIRGTLGAMRQVKSESELALLRKAIEYSTEAHRAAMNALRPGMYEYEIAALMEYIFARAGCERPGYAQTVGSGFNSTVLHYDLNRRQMQAGDLVVIDVGAECAGYTADITRTLPVSGSFTSRQREIYEIVLGVEEAVLAAVKPGMTLARTGPNSLYKIAYDYINSHGKDLQGEPLGKCFLHGIGHHIGLEVHDAGDVNRPLEPGMVITVEPGIYIPEENLGVRIEDIVLVTETGASLLTGTLARDPDEIERLLAAARKRAEMQK